MEVQISRRFDPCIFRWRIRLIGKSAILKIAGVNAPWGFESLILRFTYIQQEVVMSEKSTPKPKVKPKKKISRREWEETREHIQYLDEDDDFGLDLDPPNVHGD